jgi:phycocyanin-associated rod linker protein
MVDFSIAAELGIEPVQKPIPTELRSPASQEDINIAIQQAYRQVLGNEYVMASDRLTSAESLLQEGAITVRDFVRAIALSELYREKFFYPNQQTRFIELNYKHLLGRAPYDRSEIAYHVDLYNRAGYEAEINSYIDSVEYYNNFGDRIVPYYRGFVSQPGQKTVGYNRLFQLYQGYANSDRAQNQSHKASLTQQLSRNLPSRIDKRPRPGISYENQVKIQQRLEKLKPTTTSMAVTKTVPYEIQRQCREQAQEIEQLQQKIAELRPVAAIGEEITNRFATTSDSATTTEVPPIPTSEPSITDNQFQWDLYSKQQQRAIEYLRSKLDQLRRLSVLGEARLNKWRPRNF